MRNRDDFDNLSLAPSYHSTAPEYHTVLIASTTRNALNTSAPACHQSSAGGLQRVESQTLNLNVYSIPGFSQWNMAPGNEKALKRIATRRHSENLQHAMATIEKNKTRSIKSHPMSVSNERPNSKSFAPQEDQDSHKCPLERDNKSWDYMYMHTQGFKSVEQYHRHCEEARRRQQRERVSGRNGSISLLSPKF